MKTHFSLVAASLLACALLPGAAFGDDDNQGQNQDTRPDGRGDRIKGAPPKASTGSVVTGNGISYHGGPVLHTIHLYYIWYGSNWDTTGQAILRDFALSDGSSPYFAINTTYGDTTGNVPNVVTFMGETTVTGSSTSLSDSDIANIVATAMGPNHFGGTPDINGVYMVLTAPGIMETSGFLTRYCGWHTNGTFTDGMSNWDIKYAFVGNPAGPSIGNCAAQTSSSPNGDPGADAAVSIVAHELEETATDPDLNAWYDGTGAENADKCAWTFGATYNTSNGSVANMRLGTRDFLIQQNWLNAQGGICTLSYASASPDFSVSASPASRSVVQGNFTSYPVAIAATGGLTATVSLSASGLPSGASATFTQPSVSGGSGNSTMNVTTSSSTPAGTYTLTIMGTSSNPSLFHSTTVSLTVTTAATPNFSISASPSSQSVTPGNGTSYTATVAPSGGFLGTVSLNAMSGLPPGASATFSPTAVSNGSGNSTMAVTTSSTTPAGTYTVTITGTSGGLTQSTTVTLVVNSSGTPGFSVSASPSPQTVTRGNNATYTVTVTSINGFNGSVSLSVRGLPSNSTASFNPSSLTGKGTSTLTINTNASTSTGTFSVRIRGSSGGVTHSVTVQLTVK